MVRMAGMSRAHGRAGATMSRDGQASLGHRVLRGTCTSVYIVCRERHAYRNVGVRVTQDAKTEDAEAAMSG